MFRLKEYARTQLARAAATASIIATMAVLVGGGSATAATYNYCSNCLIYASSSYPAASAVYLTLNYVHRLSGPGSGVTIGAIAQYTDDYSFGSWATSTSTEVTHGYSGSRRAWGYAGNFGAGNYRFNAHVNY